MKLYNTLTRTIEDFIPYKEGKVKMYTCGPTVYDYAHIGNLRTYISEDIFEKTLKYLGYNVDRAMNITDVGHLTSDADAGEDKMFKGAQREHKTVWEISEFYTNAFFKDCEELNIRKPDKVEKATANVMDFIEMIKVLEEKGYTYFINGNVYFDISKFPNYTELSKLNLNELKEASRDEVEVDLNKKNPQDFVLWFTKSKFEDQAMKWDSPWGVGYPGWHIECSALAIKYLGEYLDIHCGGVDHVNIHHTNEIAQAESYLGHKWCKYWMHCEFLVDQTGKMSKSKGEFLTLSLIKSKGYNPLEYRLMCLGSHYRNQLVFTYDSLDGAQSAYNKLISRVKSVKENDNGEVDQEAVKKYQLQFIESLENDLNTSLALTTLYDVLKADINNKTKLYLIEDFDQVLSLDLLKESNLELDQELKVYIEDKINKRNQAKKDGNYVEADKIREELLSKGIVIKDTREGTIFELNK